MWQVLKMVWIVSEILGIWTLHVARSLTGISSGVLKASNLSCLKIILCVSMLCAVMHFLKHSPSA